MAGDTVEFTQVFADYPPSDGWELTVRLITDPPTVAVVTDDGAQTYTVTFAAGATEDVATQTPARLFARVSLPSDYSGDAGVAGESHTVLDQIVTVLPNLGTATASTLATHASRMLALVKAAIEGTLPANMQSYSIGGRAVQRYTPAELMGLKARYQHEVWLEQNPTKAMPSFQMAFNAPR